MTRSLLALSALGACALSIVLIDGCNNAKCGAGTMLVQKPDGTTVCEIATFPTPLYPCDNGDGGTTIVSQGGRCVSHRQCDPGTTMEGMLPDGTIVCVGTGNGNGCPPCSNTDPNSICFTGTVYDWTTKMPLAAPTDSLRIGVYEPLSFLANPSTMPIIDDTTTKGCYTFPQVSASSFGSGLAAIGLQDPAGTPTPKYVINGSAAQVSPGGNYTIDVYAITTAIRDGWNTSAGVDFTMPGAMVAQFCDDPVPPPTARAFSNCKHPVSGVQFTTGGAPAANVHYFMDRLNISKTLTATVSGIGLAIAPSAGLAPYTGTGGMCNGGMACKFETLNDASQKNVVFVQFLYACNTAMPGTMTCM